jgi:hypothetical protein
MRREKNQISKIRNEKRELSKNTKRIIRDYFQNLYSKNLENQYYPKLNQEDVNHLNRSKTCNEVEAAIVCQKKKSPGPDRFSAEFYQTFK